MNIYKEKNRKNSRANSYSENADRKSNKIDVVEYTNMSSYERYLRNKESNDKRDSAYTNNSVRPYESGRYNDRYEYQDRYDDRNMRYDDEYDSRPPQYYDRRRDYYYEEKDRRRDDYYPPYRDEGYDLRRQNSAHGGKKNKKGGLTLKAKLMIGVYFVLVAFIAVLIIINAIPGAKADSTVKMPEKVSYEESVLYKTENGDKIDIVDGVLDKDGNPVIDWQE